MRTILIFISLVSAITVFGQNANVSSVVVPKEDPASSTIRARVFYEDTGRAVKRTSVMFISKNGGGRESGGVTDGQGNLEIRNLRAGKYYAIVNAPGVVSPLAYIDIRKDRASSFDEQLAGFAPIIVDGISEIVVQIPVRRGAAISGRVVYSDGDAAIGVKVEILRKVEDDYLLTLPNFSFVSSMMGGGAGTLQTDDRGYFRFAGLPAGEYIVKASENVNHSVNRSPGNGDPFESLLFGSGSMVTVFFENAFEKSSAKPIIVSFGDEFPEIRFVIPDRDLHGLAGKVVSAKAKLPIRGAKLYLQRLGDDVGGNSMSFERARQEGLTDDKGNWTFSELPKGKYKVFIEAENAEFDEVQQVYGRNYSNRSANTANTSYNGSNSQTNKPPARKFAKKIQEISIGDEDVADLVLELDFGSTISGTVTTDVGNELPNTVTIKVTNENAEFSRSALVYNYNYEDEPGSRKLNHEFKIEGVTAGKTFLSVFPGDNDYYVKSATSGGVDLLKEGFDVKDSDDLRNVQIVLAKDVGTLKGMLLDSDKQPIARDQISLVPTDPLKYRNSSFYRTAISDENGEFEIKLAPMEYAVVSIPERAAEKGRDDFYKWLAEAVKSAQTFKIEAGKTQKITVKREPKKITH